MQGAAPPQGWLTVEALVLAGIACWVGNGVALPQQGVATVGVHAARLAAGVATQLLACEGQRHNSFRAADHDAVSDLQVSG